MDQQDSSLVRQNDERLKELLAQLKVITETDCGGKTNIETNGIKKEFYTILNALRFAPRAEGEPEVDFNVLENEFKNLFNIYHTKRTEFIAKQEKALKDNLKECETIIAKVQTFIASPESIHEHVNEFKELQQKWNAVGDVTASESTRVNKEYNKVREEFYDLLKINIELRDYDFKKNLEEKTALCEKAETLTEAEDVVAAHRELQTLHKQWSRIGPVAKDMREQLWNRFKEASTIVNKRHNDYFEEKKKIDEVNLEKKKVVLEKMREIDPSQAKNVNDWTSLSDKMKALQQEWKDAGFTPSKLGEEVYNAYHEVCDKFFSLKNDFFATINEERKANQKLKQELIDVALSLKDSDEFKETAAKFAELQKKWKEIGPVSQRVSNAMWKQFNGACDEFFKRRKESFLSKREEENQNLAKKREVIDKINAIDVKAPKDEVLALVKQLNAEFNAIGHVPFSEKDALYKDMHIASDRVYDALNVDDDKRPADLQKLRRQAEKLRADIATAENNILFFARSSAKKGNSLLDGINSKIDSMKNELVKVEGRIKKAESEKA